jgi:hypothetical protein
VSDYRAFLDGKSQYGAADGFEPEWMPDFLSPFQRDLTAGTGAEQGSLFDVAGAQ